MNENPLPDTPLKVLVIDDTESHASLVARVVKKHGLLVDVVHSAEDGLLLFGEQNFDLVITDIFMDGMGGLEGISKIRTAHPGVMIIAMSAGYSNMSAQKALETAEEVGADAVLPKPFALADLRLTVTALLEARDAG